MDNLTHTLIGALAGDTLARTTAADEHGLPEQTRRNLFVTLGAIGSNLPDTDLLYSYLDGKIGYLLHHRGHTHTVVGALVLAAIVYAITMWLLRRRNLQASGTDRLWVAAILLVASLLHVGMDGTNNYGVHPFWPLYDGWVYGDSVFIIEPLLWAAGAPLAFLLRTLLARILVLVLVAAGVALAFFSGLIPTAIAIAFAVLSVAMLAIGYFSPPRVALGAGVALWLGTTLMFIVTGRIARSDIDELAANALPEAQLLDGILTPMPANPICWETVLVQLQDETVALRRGMLSIAPRLLSADECLGRSLDMPSTAPLQTVKIPDSDTFKWYGEVLTPRDQLTDLVASDCLAAAAMRFIRAPWLTEVDGKLVLGDLRYDREKELGFAEIEIGGDGRCPGFVPPWLPPRADLLR